jgi:hypothetical protein
MEFAIKFSDSVIDKEERVFNHATPPPQRGRRCSRLRGDTEAKR